MNGTGMGRFSRGSFHVCPLRHAHAFIRMDVGPFTAFILFCSGDYGTVHGFRYPSEVFQGA